MKCDTVFYYTTWLILTMIMLVVSAHLQSTCGTSCDMLLGILLNDAQEQETWIQLSIDQSLS